MNLGVWPARRAHLTPDNLFLKQDDFVCSNRMFAGRVGEAAALLAARGVGRGDRVAVLMTNGSAFLEIFFACAGIGAIFVPLNHQLAAPELARILADCDPRLFIHSRSFAPLAGRLAGSVPPSCFLSHPEGSHPAAAAFPCRPRPFAEAAPPVAQVALTDPLVIMFTSGTTGTLKGAVLTHGNFLFGAIHGMLSYGFGPSTLSLVVAPLFHIGALAASVTPVIYAGGGLILRAFDNPSEVLHLIARERVNYLFAVPVMFKMLTKAPAWPEADFSHVQLFMAGGAPMPRELILQYQEEKGVNFAQGYGMTETQRITALTLNDARRKAGSIGKEVFHTRVRLVDDRDRDVAPGETGEVIVQGPTVFAGYWHNEKASAEALRDGWFHTGDLGCRDEEGFLYLVGRKADLIISSGENIYAAEVERAIESLAGVAEAAVVGRPDVNRGEVAVAFVVMEENAKRSGDELLGELKTALAPYKIPKRIVFLDSLPRLGSGKIDKRQLRAAAAAAPA